MKNFSSGLKQLLDCPLTSWYQWLLEINVKELKIWKYENMKPDLCVHHSPGSPSGQSCSQRKKSSLRNRRRRHCRYQYRWVIDCWHIPPADSRLCLLWGCPHTMCSWWMERCLICSSSWCLKNCEQISYQWLLYIKQEFRTLFFVLFLF